MVQTEAVRWYIINYDLSCAKFLTQINLSKYEYIYS